MVVVVYWGLWFIGILGGADAIGALPLTSAAWDVPGVFQYSEGIPKPHQLGGGTGPDIADANRSVVSLICSSEVDGLVVIGIDCALVTPNVLGGTGISGPAAAVAADGAVTTGDPG